MNVEEFLRDGYVVIRGAVDTDTAASVRDIIWDALAARGLLALFLFTDVGHNDAPTRLALGSHLAMARTLAPAGETVMSGEQSIAGSGPRCCAGPSCTRPAGPAMCSCDTRSSCTPQPGPIAAQRRG